MNYNQQRKIKTSSRQRNSTDNLTDQALIQLNSVTKSTDHRLTQAVERHVDKYLSTISKEARKNLSRTQMVRSGEKVYLWERENRLNINAKKLLSLQDFENDIDPAFRQGKTQQKRRHLAYSTKGRILLEGSQFETISPPPKHNHIEIDKFKIFLMSRSREYKKSVDAEKEEKRKLHNIAIWKEKEEARKAIEAKTMKSASEFSTNELIEMYVKSLEEKEDTERSNDQNKSEKDENLMIKETYGIKGEVWEEKGDGWD